MVLADGIETIIKGTGSVATLRNSQTPNASTAEMKLGSPSKKVQRQTHIVNCIAMNRPFAQPRSHADRSRQGVSEAETMSGVEEVYQTLKSLSYSFFLSFTHSVMFFLKLDKLFRCLIFVLVFDYTQNTQVFFR